MLLTFKEGKFKLCGDDRDVKHALLGNSNWRFKSGTGYYTTNFKAAAKLSGYADDEAAKILNRAFVKHYSPDTLPPLPLFLDALQADGVKWVLSRSRSYLAHAPGAGKTWEAVTAALLARGAGQNVFIVPPGLVLNWAREIEKITALLPEITWPRVAIVPESRFQDFTGWRADFLIVPDSMLTKPWVLESLTKIKKKLIAVDEASRFKEANAARTIALFGGRLKDGRESPGLVYDARHAVLLDGSPMPNRTMELWAPTYAMSPESIGFMSQQDFGFKYCGAKMNRYGRWEFRGNTNSEELRARLQKDFMHVIREDQLNHPERLRSILFMDKDVRTPTMKAWEKKNLSRISLSDLGDDIGQGDIARYRKELGLKKVAWVADYVAGRLEAKNESLVLFAWHREVIFELEKRLRKYKPALVLGGTDSKNRERGFARFQDGSLRLIIGNILAMGRGHNLQRGDRAVFAEYSWCDETNIQAEKRIARRGNLKKSMRADYVSVPNSLDEVVLQAVFRKANAVKRVIG